MRASPTMGNGDRRFLITFIDGDELVRRNHPKARSNGARPTQVQVSVQPATITDEPASYSAFFGADRLVTALANSISPVDETVKR